MTRKESRSDGDHSWRLYNDGIGLMAFVFY